MHLPHLMQSLFERLLRTSNCIGHTLSHFLQLMHFSSSRIIWYLSFPKMCCSVPIGQKVHHVLGFIETPTNIATVVVVRHIITNTMPIWLNRPWVCSSLYPMNPIINRNMGTLIQRLLSTGGIFLFWLIFPTQKSLKLPLGHRFPQNHLPLKGLMISKVTNISSMKYPRTGYHKPAMDTISTSIPRYGVIFSIFSPRQCF